jgi:murein DD-endopeptidase MepM/ murein hydrolase activator NlpD
MVKILLERRGGINYENYSGQSIALDTGKCAVKIRKRIVPPTQFNEVLIRSNALTDRGFYEWAFYPGMLFLSRDRWWGNGGMRDRPHEGVDFCFYKDREGRINHVSDTPLAIPVLYEGTVVHLVEDYIGTSLFVLHDIYDTNGNQLYTIYGHIDPSAGIRSGVAVREGSIIATIADAGKKKAKMSSHLHLSIAWISPAYPHERLDWKSLADHDRALLVNPLLFIDSTYTVLQYPSRIRRGS